MFTIDWAQRIKEFLKYEKASVESKENRLVQR